MADRKENEVGKVTSIADGSYVRMLDANGNSVQIDKASFIEAVRVAMPVATVEKAGLLASDIFAKSLIYRGRFGASDANRDSCITNGTWFQQGFSNNQNDDAYLIVCRFINSSNEYYNSGKQFLFGLTANQIMFRRFTITDQVVTFQDWQKVVAI